MMNLFINFLMQMKNNKKGQGMVEYGLIIGLIAIVVIVALTAMGGKLDDIFQFISGKLGGAVPSSSPAAS